MQSIGLGVGCHPPCGGCLADAPPAAAPLPEPVTPVAGLLADGACKITVHAPKNTGNTVGDSIEIRILFECKPNENVPPDVDAMPLPVVTAETAMAAWPRIRRR